MGVISKGGIRGGGGAGERKGPVVLASTVIHRGRSHGIA